MRAMLERSGRIEAGEGYPDPKLQVLVYDNLPTTTAAFSYAIENCQLTSRFFVGAQAVVSLLQTTQTVPDVCFIIDHVAYGSSNKTKIV